MAASPRRASPWRSIWTRVALVSPEWGMEMVVVCRAHWEEEQEQRTMDNAQRTMKGKNKKDRIDLTDRMDGRRANREICAPGSGSG